ncbi:VPS4-associated protein 1 [Hysterangium stoloniferum]|nr:VPS4-associated protein 1 [Hysterangium stoloniferum]
MATFQNLYYKRTAATAKSCYMCYRPTTTVLATLNTTDFLYTCDGHLTDKGFATRIEAPKEDVTKEAKKVTDEEIKRVREEWEERQRKKKEKETAEKDNTKDNGTDKGKDKDKETSPSAKSSPPPPTPVPVPGSSAPIKPTHDRYVLHRDVWAMRLAEHKKRRQTLAVKEVAPKLPVAPRSTPL